MRFPDLSLAFRNIFRRPGFAAVAIALLALGSGANAAVFSVVRGVLIRPLPFPEPDRLVAVWPNQFISNEDLDYWRERTHSFSEIAAQSPGWMMGLVADGGEPIKVTGGARLRQPVQDARRDRGARPHDRARRRHSRTASRRGVVRRAVAQPIQRRSVDHRPRHSARSGTAHDHRRDAGGLRSLRSRHRSVGAAAVDAGQRAVQGHLLAERRAARAGRHAGSGDARARRSRAGDAQGSRRDRISGARRSACRRCRTRSPATCGRRC